MTKLIGVKDKERERERERGERFAERGALGEIRAPGEICERYAGGEVRRERLARGKALRSVKIFEIRCQKF